MAKIPEDRDAQLAFLEAWADEQLRRVGEQHRRLAEEDERRLYAEELARVVVQARQRLGQVDSIAEVGVIPVVITKPSDVPADRAAVFADLMVRLREYRWADPIVSECDEPRYIAPNAIDLVRRHRPGARWFLYMEDDVVLGPDFGLLPGLLSEADELFPHAGLVSFFYRWGKPGWSIHPMDGFGWVQCAAIRNTDHLVGFRAFIDDVVTQSAGKTIYELPDVAVQAFLATEYDAFALWCPSLVQHADVTSAFFGEPGPRLSWSYTQAYG